MVRDLDHLNDSTSAQLIISVASGNEMQLICTKYSWVCLRSFIKMQNIFTEEHQALN